MSCSSVICYSLIIKKHCTNWLFQDEFYRFSCTGLSYCVSTRSRCAKISKVHVMFCLELIRPEALLQVGYLTWRHLNLVSLALLLYETVITMADSEPVKNKWHLLSGACVHVCVGCGHTLENVADKCKHPSPLSWKSKVLAWVQMCFFGDSAC